MELLVKYNIIWSHLIVCQLMNVAEYDNYYQIEIPETIYLCAKLILHYSLTSDNTNTKFASFNLKLKIKTIS